MKNTGKTIVGGKKKTAEPPTINVQQSRSSKKAQPSKNKDKQQFTSHQPNQKLAQRLDNLQAKDHHLKSTLNDLKLRLAVPHQQINPQLQNKPNKNKLQINSGRIQNTSERIDSTNFNKQLKLNIGHNNMAQQLVERCKGYQSYIQNLQGQIEQLKNDRYRRQNYIINNLRKSEISVKQSNIDMVESRQKSGTSTPLARGTFDIGQYMARTYKQKQQAKQIEKKAAQLKTKEKLQRKFIKKLRINLLQSNNKSLFDSNVNLDKSQIAGNGLHSDISAVQILQKQYPQTDLQKDNPKNPHISKSLIYQPQKPSQPNTESLKHTYQNILAQNSIQLQYPSKSSELNRQVLLTKQSQLKQEISTIKDQLIKSNKQLQQQKKIRQNYQKHIYEMDTKNTQTQEQYQAKIVSLEQQLKRSQTNAKRLEYLLQQNLKIIQIKNQYIVQLQFNNKRLKTQMNQKSSIEIYNKQEINLDGLGSRLQDIVNKQGREQVSLDGIESYGNIGNLTNNTNNKSNQQITRSHNQQSDNPFSRNMISSQIVYIPRKPNNNKQADNNNNNDDDVLANIDDDRNILDNDLQIEFGESMGLKQKSLTFGNNKNSQDYGESKEPVPTTKPQCISQEQFQQSSEQSSQEQMNIEEDRQKVKKYRQKNMQLQQSTELLSSQLQHIQTKLQKTQKQKEHLAQAHEKLAQKITVLEQENVKISRLHSKYSSENQELKQKLQDSLKFSTSLSQQAFKLHMIKKQSEQNIKYLSKLLEQQQKKIRETSSSSQITPVQQQLQKLQKKLQQYKEQNQIYEMLNKQLQSQVKSHVDLTYHLESTINKQQRQIQGLQDNVQKTKDQNDRLLQKIKNIQEDREQSVVRHKKQQQQIQMLNNLINDMNLQIVKAKIIQTQRQVSFNMGNSRHHQHFNTNDYAQREQYYKRIQQEVCELRSNLQQKEVEIMEYKDMGEKIVMIEDVINKKKQEIQSLKLLLEEKQQCIRELQNNLNNQVPALPIQNVDHKKQQYPETQIQPEQYRDGQIRVQSDRKSKEQQITQLQLKIKLIQQRIKTILMDLNEKNQQNQTLKSAMQQKQKNIQQLNQYVHRLQNLLPGQLRAKLVTQPQQNTDDGEHKRVQGLQMQDTLQVGKGQTMLRSKEQQIVQLQKTIKVIQQRIRIIMKDLEDKNEQNQSLKAILEQRQRNIQQLSQYVHELQILLPMAQQITDGSHINNTKLPSDQLQNQGQTKPQQGQALQTKASFSKQNKEQQIRQLQKTIKLIQQRIKLILKDSDDKNEEIQNLKSALQQEKDRNTQQLTQMQQKIFYVQKLNEQLQQYNRLTTLKVSQLQEKLSSQQQQLSNKFDQYKSKIQIYKNRLQQKQTQLSNITKSQQQHKIQQQQISILRLQKIQLQQSIHNIKEQNQSLHKLIQDHNATIQDKQREIRNKSIEISNQEEMRLKEKEEYERMYRDLESSVAAEKEKLEYLFKEKLDISNQLMLQRDRIIEQSNKQLLTKTNRINQLQKLIEKSDKDSTGYTQMISKLQQELQKLTQQCLNQQIQFDVIIKKNQLLTESLKKKQEELYKKNLLLQANQSILAQVRNQNLVNAARIESLEKIVQDSNQIFVSGIPKENQNTVVDQQNIDKMQKDISLQKFIEEVDEYCETIVKDYNKQLIQMFKKFVVHATQVDLIKQRKKYLEQILVFYNNLGKYTENKYRNLQQYVQKFGQSVAINQSSEEAGSPYTPERQQIQNKQLVLKQKKRSLKLTKSLDMLFDSYIQPDKQLSQDSTQKKKSVVMQQDFNNAISQQVDTQDNYLITKRPDTIKEQAQDKDDKQEKASKRSGMFVRSAHSMLQQLQAQQQYKKDMRNLRMKAKQHRRKI